MNFLFADIGALSRASLGLACLVLAACSTGTQVADPEVFELTEGALRKRFPKMQKIGVVELSGARIKDRAFSEDSGEREYLATGGALLIKRTESPILAQAPEILVTPEAAVLRGKQAMVKRNGQLIRGEDDETEFVIDGTQVKIQGPHSILTPETGNRKSASVAEEPRPESKRVSAKKEERSTKPAINQVVKPSAKPTLSPAIKPSPSIKPAPKIDRKELLNLMREPSE